MGDIDTLEFAPKHTSNKLGALDQLKNYPSPQFKMGHQLMPNFLWMDPSFLGGLLQPNYKMKDCVKMSTKIQAELSSYWHYYMIVNTNLKAYKNYADTNTFAGAWVKYANANPKVPAAAISFWAQIQPNKTLPDCPAKLAYVYNNQLPDCCYVHNSDGAVISRKFASPIAPVAALKCDFETQSIYVDSLLHALKRPLQMINENGEVFKLYEDDFLAQDASVVAIKNKFPDLNWNEFQAMKRLEKEIAYRNSFMQKKALANCLYSEYAIDGQNQYRHDYKTMRQVNSKINNQYYATPDFYPRYPYNWKDWKGPWHGLKWLEISRKTEIALGDNLFSPFVAAGWDSTETNNIRPAQWLGLLKILGALGAEYYYSGFFNTGKSVAKPENYIWQAAMPVYAQAVTSYYEDLLRNGSILNNDHLIQYAEDDVPVVIRKSNLQQTWLIACTWQTGSNFNKNMAIDKLVEIDLGHKKIKVKARRQGSVYVYSEEGPAPVFYQIDSWHEFMHPSYWNKNIKLEAELYGSHIVTEGQTENDYSRFTSFVSLDSTIQIPFELHGEHLKMKQVSCWIKCLNGENSTVKIFIDDMLISKIQPTKNNNFVKYTVLVPEQIIKQHSGIHNIKLQFSNKGAYLDKIEIHTN